MASDTAFLPAEGQLLFFERKLLQNILLLSIVVLAACLRFIGLDQHPPGLFRDEAEKGYNAWALVTSGGVIELSGGGAPAQHPIKFKSWPWMINVLGTRTSAIYQYVDAPFVGFGGLTVANTRRAAALAGTLAVLAMGLFGIRIWGATPGLLIALWLTLSPWHLVFSRWALQGTFVPLLLACALGGCWGVERNRTWGWPLLSAALGWLFYSYSGTQPFVLALGFVLLLVYRRRIRVTSPSLWLGMMLFALPIIPTLIVMLGPEGTQRLDQVAIWRSGEHGLFRLAFTFLKNYLLHFSPDYLFLHGDPQPRHAIPGMGVLLRIDALLLPAGMYIAFKRKLPLRWIVLAMMLCGPLPAAITKDAPHALRSFPEALPCIIWSGLGLSALLTSVYGKLIREGTAIGKAWTWTVCLLVACCAFGLNGFARYWRGCESDSGMHLAFQGTMRNAWELLAREKKSNQQLYFSTLFPYAPYFQLFFQTIPPKQAANDGLEARGVTYFNSNLQSYLPPLKQGDWVLTPLMPDEPLILQMTGLNASNARRIGEYWARLEHFE